MSYNGEGPSKKVVRLKLWRAVKEQLGGRFYTGLHFVLSSSQAGDVSVLLGLGVPAKNIIGIDKDKHAVAAARHKFKNVKIVQGDFAKVIEAFKGKDIASVHIDLCAHISDDHVDKIARVAKCLKKGTVLSWAFLAGRERGHWKDKVAAAYKVKRSYSRLGNKAFGVRAFLISDAISKKCKRAKRYLRPKHFWYYKNWNEDDTGIPMIVSMSKMEASPVNLGKSLTASKYENVQYTPVGLGAVAADLIAGGERTHLLLNVTRGTVAAWKAHFTRGTY